PLWESVTALGVQRENFLPRHHTAALGPPVVLLGHLPHELGMLRSAIAGLGAVGIDVVQLPVQAVLAHQLPPATSYTRVAFVLPEQVPLHVLPGTAVVLAKHRNQAVPFQ